MPWILVSTTFLHEFLTKINFYFHRLFSGKLRLRLRFCNFNPYSDSETSRRICFSMRKRLPGICPLERRTTKNSSSSDGERRTSRSRDKTRKFRGKTRAGNALSTKTLFRPCHRNFEMVMVKNPLAWNWVAGQSPRNDFQFRKLSVIISLHFMNLLEIFELFKGSLFTILCAYDLKDISILLTALQVFIIFKLDSLLKRFNIKINLNTNFHLSMKLLEC